MLGAAGGGQRGEERAPPASLCFLQPAPGRRRKRQAASSFQEDLLHQTRWGYFGEPGSSPGLAWRAATPPPPGPVA